MNNVSFLTVCLLLTGTLTGPVYAQKWGKVSTELKKTSEIATVANRAALNNPAFAAALQHAQALQTLREASLVTSQSAAAQVTLSAPKALSHAALQNTKRVKSFHRTPQQWLDELETFVQRNNRYPSSYYEEERTLYSGAQNAIQRLGPNSSISQRIRQLRKQYPVVYQTKSPEQWLDELEKFVQLNKHFPSQSSKDPLESKLYTNVSAMIRHLGPDNPIARQASLLRQQYPLPGRNTNTPQQWLEKLEAFVEENGRFPSTVSEDLLERKLYTNVSELIRRLGPDNPIAQRASLLRQQYPPQRPNTNTPQQWLEKLEAFVEENERFPSQLGKDATEKALYTNVLITAWRLGPQDPISQRILWIRKQYPGIQRGKSAQQWLDELEAFVQKEGCLPSQGISAQETSLYNGIWRLRMILDKKDPIAQRIEQLYTQFIPRSGSSAKTPEQWLEELETFVEQNGRFPTTKNGEDEKKLYVGVMNLKYRFGTQDPLVQRIIQLRIKYNNQPSVF